MEIIKKTCGRCARKYNVADYNVVCKYCEHAEFFTPEHIENHCDGKETEEDTDACA